MTKLLKALFLTLLFTLSATAYAGPVNINTADAESLAMNIKGVGAKKAAAIIEYRKKNGPFKKVEDLMRIKGIGPKILANNQANIILASHEVSKEKKPLKLK